MSHGKKKFIEAYDGRIKRSNDRTKKDYYRDLKWWEPWEDGKLNSWKMNSTREFCPQCKHNYKPIKAHNEAYWTIVRQLRAEWEAMHAKEIVEYNRDMRVWRERMQKAKMAGNKPEVSWLYVIQPHHPERSYWKYYEANKHRIPAKPIRAEEAWLCPKHRHKNDKKDEMWSTPYPGRKRGYAYTRKQDWKGYKNEVKSIMQKAKYNEDYYDAIPKYKRGWLD
jgi:hypothetical protein